MEAAVELKPYHAGLVGMTTTYFAAEILFRVKGRWVLNWGCSGKAGALWSLPRIKLMILGFILGEKENH